MAAKARLLLLLATILCHPAIAHSLTALTSNTTTYISNVDYAPHGAINRWRLANQKIYEEWGFNSRLQQTSAKTGTALAASDLLELGFGYGTTNNNGNLLTQDIKHPKQAGGTLALQQTYSYDKINRLTNMSEAVISGGTAQSLNWNVGYGFDPFGNVFASGGAEAHAAMARAANHYNPATNRQIKYASNGTAMPADAYNTAGDLKNHPEIGQMAYDVEGRLVEHIAGPKTIRYFYDGDGQRIRREQGTAITYYIYGADGALMSEYGATEATETTTSYLHTDHLGSTRLVTKVNESNQVEPTARMDYLPYGLEIEGQASKAGRDLVTGFGSVAGGTVKFTGKERDGDTGLDYFGARYFASPQGRWTNPDSPFADQDPRIPQSWNLYSYTRNNPHKYIDSNGESTAIATWGRELESAGNSLPGLGKLLAYAGAGLIAVDAAWENRDVIGSALGKALSAAGSSEWGPEAPRPYLQEQARTPDGKFAGKSTGETAPGSEQEKKGLAAVGATKNTGSLTVTDPKTGAKTTTIPDGKTKDGQFVEVKSGQAVSGTKQVNAMAQGAKAASGQPLQVVVNPGTKISRPVKNNPNIQIVEKPLK